MITLVTNRNIQDEHFDNGIGNHQAFGEKPNVKGANEVRIATAEKRDGEWRVKLIAEPPQLDPDNLPSRVQFDEIRTRLTQSERNCVFFVHGFNKPFDDSLEQALEIERLYDVEVILFSWPSNPGGFKTKEYRHAKRIAHASMGALDATLEKLGGYLQQPFNRDALEACGVKFSFMTYSLGNLMFQNYVRNAAYEGETNMFDNVVLCQADVDSEGHAEWVQKIAAGKRVYITINENDFVLKWSDANFQKDRLGRTVRDLNASNASYFDFTDGPNVGRTHGIFYKKTNDVVRAFFNTVLNGGRGDHVEGLTYDPRTNAHGFY